MQAIVGLVLACIVAFFMGVVVGPSLRPDTSPHTEELDGAVPIVDIRAKEAAVARVSTSLDYLLGVPEVAWYEVRPNNVYLGCQRRSASIETIVREAAVHASAAYPSDFHVWAVPVEEIAQVGQKSMPFFCRATARDGELLDFSRP